MKSLTHCPRKYNQGSESISRREKRREKKEMKNIKHKKIINRIENEEKLKVNRND